MHSQYDFSKMMGERSVYVRSVKVEDLPEEMQEQARGREELFGVFSAEGEQLALTADRKMAFVLARQNDFAPVSVH